ncbi:aspartate/glutamate racemase family protein [Shewanella maritima]|uniref:aspartate/glutamate racemase family protein n=1 Tax=Shewanella maritima TaxID=2520507 RepID=UPI003736856B
MKTIGLLGGMSWESTQDYYKAINNEVNQALGGLHSAQIAMYSVDFAPIEALQHQGDWQATAKILSQAAKNVEAAGADFLVICTNTMHKVADEVAASVSIPLLHIADATGAEVLKLGVSKVGLLGTAFTMEQDFYKARLKDKFGIDVIVPDEADRLRVHQVIYQELCLGKVQAESKADYLRIISHLSESGAEAVILGCTEIGLLVNQSDIGIPLLNTARIHSQHAVKLALTEE